MSKRTPPKGKEIKPHFWVFCEGETEEAYICFLRTEYRLNIEIVPKVSGSSISEKYISNYKKGKPTHEKDKNFLVYDGDVAEVMIRLRKITLAHLIISNPCIEFWFLLHYKNHNSPISNEKCISEICNRNRTIYKKGVIDDILAQKIRDRRSDACSRARALNFAENPSSNMYLLIDELDKIKSR